MSKNKHHFWSSQVRMNFSVAQGICLLTLSIPDGLDFMPGQFICLEPLHPSCTMLRPFSVHSFNEMHKQISIYYKVIGKNTKLMSGLKENDEIKVLGPLGSGLEISDEYDLAMLVSGGIGVAPMDYFGKVLHGKGISTSFFYGNKTKSEILDTPGLFDKFFITTEDGSVGTQGFITDRFAKELFDLDINKMGKVLVITCGPNPMMQKIAEICSSYKNIDCYVILETVMACGIGQCLGCSVQMKSGMKRICHEGPIFNAKEVIWDELKC